MVFTVPPPSWVCLLILATVQGVSLGSSMLSCRAVYRTRPISTFVDCRWKQTSIVHLLQWMIGSWSPQKLRFRRRLHQGHLVTYTKERTVGKM